MALTVTHATVVAISDDGTSPVGSDEWNAAHVVSGSIGLTDIPSGAAGTILWSVGAGPAAWTATPTIATRLGLGSVTAPVHTLDITAAGTATVAPIRIKAGTNLTTAAAGVFEYDGNELFFSPAASDRRVLPAIAYIRQHATYTLTSQTATQKLFNGSATGAITLPTGWYEFECLAALASMSATSGNALFSIVNGTGTLANSLIMWKAIDAAATATGGVVFQSGYALTVAPALSPTDMATATTNTNMAFWVRGTFEVSVAGTFIPSIALTTAAAAVVQIGSSFRCIRLGAATDVAVGNWS